MWASPSPSVAVGAGSPQGQPQGQPGHSPHAPAPARGVPAALLPLLTAALKSVTRIWGGTAPRASAPAGEPWHRATVSGAAALGGSPTSAPCPWHSARLGLRGRAQGQQRAGGTAAPAQLPWGRPAPCSVTLQPSPSPCWARGPRSVLAARLRSQPRVRKRLTPPASGLVQEATAGRRPQLDSCWEGRKGKGRGRGRGPAAAPGPFVWLGPAGLWGRGGGGAAVQVPGAPRAARLLLHATRPDGLSHRLYPSLNTD